MSKQRLTPTRIGGLQFFTAPRDRSMLSPEVDLAQRLVTTWLNGASFDDEKKIREEYSAESRDRILKLLGLVERSLNAVQLPLNTPQYPSLGQFAEIQNIQVKSDPFGEKPGPVYVCLLPALSQEMKRYTIFPTLSYHPAHGRWHVIHDLAPGNTFPTGETMAAHGLIELVRNDCFNRLRLCDCGNWYFAKRDDGVACKAACRKRIHARTPEAIAQRKKKLQENEEYKSGLIFVGGRSAKKAK